MFPPGSRDLLSLSCSCASSGGGVDDLIISVPYPTARFYVVFGHMANDPWPASFDVSSNGSLTVRNGCVIETTLIFDFQDLYMAAADLNADSHPEVRQSPLLRSFLLPVLFLHKRTSLSSFSSLALPLLPYRQSCSLHVHDLPMMFPHSFHSPQLKQTKIRSSCECFLLSLSHFSFLLSHHFGPMCPVEPTLEGQQLPLPSSLCTLCTNQLASS